MVDQWNSVEQHGGIVEEHGTVWWNSVEWYGGTVRNGMVEQWNSMVEQWNSVVEQCGRVWWNRATVEQCGGTV